jgi:hypothetical protein
MQKQVRIQGDGTVVDSDRIVKLTKQASKGGPDNVHWILAPGGGGPWTVHFDSSPFTPGPQNFAVPGPPSGPATQAVGSYKYKVLDKSGTVTHDPDVDIES